MRAEEARDLYALLDGRGVWLWLDGGWGVDALLGRQTRPHKDLDAFVALADLPLLAEILGQRGFDLKEIWEENRWLPCADPVPLIGRAAPGPEIATAFVLADGRGLELDVHALGIDGAGRLVPAWDCPLVFPEESFAGRGIIAGLPVRCLSAATHMLTHSGYALQAKDLADLRYLRERFGVAPAEDAARLLDEDPAAGVR